MQRLILVGLNHGTAPLELREKLAFSPPQRRQAIEAFRTDFPQAELVLLSTCNRVELYCARALHGHPRAEEMTAFLARTHNLSAEHFAAHLYHKAEGEVVEHLFNVAASLDSMVLGEAQILAQVREAYEAACAAGSAGALLHPLFQRAMAVGKLVRAQTSIADGRLSIAGVAVQYARQIFDRFDDKTVLCIGAGKMALLALRHFAELRPGRLLVCNRDPVKAADLAGRFGGEPAAFERLPDHLTAADIVLSSTGSADPIITRAMFEPLRKKRRYRPLYLIDIALPRDVEAAVGELEDVYLYNLDDLQRAVEKTRENRGESLEAARTLVRRQAEEFAHWHHARQVGPLIEELYTRGHELARQELERALPRLGELSEADKIELEQLTRRIVNKLLHDPVRALRRGSASKDAAADEC